MARTAFDRLKSGLEMEQASSTVFDGATSRLGAREKELYWSGVGKHPFMKTQVLALSQFGMIGSSQVGQKPGEAHMLPWRVGRQSEFATYPLSGSSPLAPRAQGEKLPMH